MEQLRAYALLIVRKYPRAWFQSTALQVQYFPHKGELSALVNKIIYHK